VAGDVVRSIGVTVLSLLAVSAIFPSGVTATPSGPPGTLIDPFSDGGLDAKLMTETIEPLATYAVDPSGAMAMAWGAALTGMVVTPRDAVLITLTDVASEFDTHTKAPLGLTAMLQGPLPTVIGAPAFELRRSIGVTVLLLKFVTYAVSPLGVIAMAAGPLPTLMGVSNVGGLVRRLMGRTVLPSEFVTYAVEPSGEMAMPRGPFRGGFEACKTVACEVDASITVTVFRLRFVT